MSRLQFLPARVRDEAALGRIWKGMRMIQNIRVRQIGSLFSEGYAASEPDFLRDRRRRREAFFAESIVERSLRLARAARRTLSAGRLPMTLRGLTAAFSPRMSGLPDPVLTPPGPAGFCGPAPDLAPATVAEGYARGMYLALLAGRLQWFSPRTRFVVAPIGLQLPQAPIEALRGRGLQVSFDRDYEAVLAACSKEKLLLPCRALLAFCDLFDQGFAHSFEVRTAEGALIAGGFGVAVGRAFVTHATFGPAAAADFGLAILNRHLAEWDYELHEAVTPPERMGFFPMPRDEHARALMVLSGRGRRTRWQADPALWAAEPMQSLDRAA